MRISLLALLFPLIPACGGGGGEAPPAPTLVFLSPSIDTLRTVGPGGATLRIAYEDDAAISNATTTLYAELDGMRLAIAEDRPHGSGALQEFDWDLSGVPEGVYTIVGEIDDGRNPAVLRIAPGTVTVTVERERLVSSFAFDDALGVAAFPDGSYAIAGGMTLPILRFNGNNATVVLGAGESNETSFTSKVGQGYVARYEWDGTLRWARRTEGALLPSTAPSLASFTSVAAMPDGGVVVKGEHIDTVTVGKGEANETTLEKVSGYDARMVVRYGADGALAWAITMQGTGGGAGGIVADADGSICFADAMSGNVSLQGLSEPGFGGLDAVVARLDADGNAVWLRRFGTAEDETLKDVALANDGAVLICGSYPLPISFGSFDLPNRGGYVTKIDVNGHVDWAVCVATSGVPVPYVDVTAVASAPDGSVYAAGALSGNAAFGTAQIFDDRSPDAAGGWFVLKLGENGSMLWAWLVSQPTVELCTHADGSVTVVGSYADPMRAGAFTLPPPGGFQTYLASFAPDGTAQGLRADRSANFDFPNDVACFPDRSTVVAGRRNVNDGISRTDGIVARLAER